MNLEKKSLPFSDSKTKTKNPAIPFPPVKMNNHEPIPETALQSQRTTNDLTAKMSADEASSQNTVDRKTELQMYTEKRQAHLEKIFEEDRFVRCTSHFIVAVFLAFVVFNLFKYCPGIYDVTSSYTPE